MSDTQRHYCDVCKGWHWFSQYSVTLWECLDCRLLIKVGVKSDLTKVER